MESKSHKYIYMREAKCLGAAEATFTGLGRKLLETQDSTPLIRQQQGENLAES